MRIYLILALLLALVVALFAAQNNAQIDIAFLVWRVRGSLALVLFATLALGVVIGLLVSLPSTIRKSLQVAEWKKTAKGLEKKLAELSSQEGEKRETPPPGGEK